MWLTCRCVAYRQIRPLRVYCRSAPIRGGNWLGFGNTRSTSPGQFCFEPCASEFPQASEMARCTHTVVVPTAQDFAAVALCPFLRYLTFVLPDKLYEQAAKADDSRFDQGAGNPSGGLAPSASLGPRYRADRGRYEGRIAPACRTAILTHKTAGRISIARIQR
jgi:hypothetical protein